MHWLVKEDKSAKSIIATAIKRASRIDFTVVIRNMRWCIMNV